MKYFICLALLSGMITAANCQNTKAVTTEVHPIAMTDRLGVDFEVKDQKEPDPVKLQLLQIDQYEHLRKQDENVEVTDPATGFVLVLYSLTRCRQNKESNPLFDQH